MPTDESTVITITPTAKPSKRNSVRCGRRRRPFVMNESVFMRPRCFHINDSVGQLGRVRIVRRHDDREPVGAQLLDE